MLKRFATLLGVAVFAIAATTANAGVLSSSLTFDGVPNTLIDNSVAWVQNDRGTVGVLDMGDVVAGMVRIETSQGLGDVSPDLGELIVLFSAQIIAAPIDLGNGSIRFQLGATTSGPADTLNGLLANHALANGLFPANAIAAVISAPAATSPLNPTEQPLATALTNVNDLTKWSLEAVLGFAPGLNIFGSADFFEAEFSDVTDVAGTGPADGQISASDILAFPEANEVGRERGGFTVLSAPGLPTVTSYLPISVVHLDGVLANATKHEITIASGDLLSPTATGPGSQLANGYLFADNARFQVNPVPEPSSMVLLALGAASACGAGLRRRRQAA